MISLLASLARAALVAIAPVFPAFTPFEQEHGIADDPPGFSGAGAMIDLADAVAQRELLPTLLRVRHRAPCPEHHHNNQTHSEKAHRLIPKNNSPESD